ncbi:hypothetical protein [Streptosporangium sp. NPDC002721]|uniref:hypothetical protein n=1 Tax=Streptosporangium sp. NPDC002721 TaxID=3366188 RepID=UPI00367E1EFE
MIREPRTAVFLRHAASAEQAAYSAPDRGASLLGVIAKTCRAAADVYASDPTLDGCPAGRERDLDLVEELCRQIRSLIRSAVSGRGAARWPVEDRWVEAEALTGRLPVILGRARAVARTDHDTPDGSREISRLWLAAASTQIRAAGEQLQAAIRRAGRLPHPAPEVAELADLAERVIEHADKLEADRG